MESKCPFKSYPMREGLEEPPRMMHGLPDDQRGYPIPYFVDYVGGEPEFRAFDQMKLVECLNKRLCWVCGKPLYREMVFVIGPMCGINRVNSEPPNHRECALYSVRNCPFLSRPHMVRREGDMPEEPKFAGIAFKRNPGVLCLWYCRKFTLVKIPGDKNGMGAGVLFDLGHPFKVQWYREGRPANREEVMESINSGLPLLYEQAENYADKLDIDARLAKLMKLVPRT